MASVFVRDASAVSRLYSQIVSPLAAFSAITDAPGCTRYITPCETIGMLSWLPFGSSFVHAVFSCWTLRRLMNSSGLYRCASYVRLYINQSSGGGLTRASVDTPASFF